MTSPFRDDAEVQRERGREIDAELAELDAMIAAARVTREGLWRRRHPLRAALLSRVTLACALVGLGAGAIAETASGALERAKVLEWPR